MAHALHHALEPSLEHDVELTVTAGHWPAGLTGQMFLIGPAQPTAVGFMFAGPGMLTRVDLATRRWRTTRVVTPDLAILAGLTRELGPAGTAQLTAGARPGLTNVAPHFLGDRLLLTGLSQRPVEFDPVTHARVPRESFHHFANYRQDGPDVTLYLAHSNGWDLNYAPRDTDRVWSTGAPVAAGLHGFTSAPVDASPVGRYVIDGTTGEVKDSKQFCDPARHWATLLYGRDTRPAALESGRHVWQAYWGCDPDMLVTAVVDLYRDHPYRVVPVDRLPVREIPSSLACLDLESMTEQSAWQFPEGTAGESPVYVPDPAGGDGWVVIVVHYPARTELQVFDALALGKGPVAVATAPGLKLSVQFHSGYTPAARAPKSGYRRSYAADLGDDWQNLPAQARDVIAAVLDTY